MYNITGDKYGNKKMPRCGAEIPVEMSFCLHCMERTDGVLEIKRKTEPSNKMIISMAVLSVLMIIVIVLLIMVLTGKGDDGNKESSVPYVITETVTENITTSTASVITTELFVTSYSTVQTQTQKQLQSSTTTITTIFCDTETTSFSTQEISESITSEIQVNNFNIITDENISPANINDNNFNQYETDTQYTEPDNNYQEIISENENPVP